MSIVCIGDSLTFGYGVKEQDNWVSRLSRKLKNEIINRGISGDTTTAMKERFRRDVVNYRPSKVIIMGGTNDIFLNEGLKYILNNIDTMVDICNKNEFLPVLLTPLPVKEDIEEKILFEDMDYKKVNHNLDKLRELLTQYANKKSIITIDLGNILLKEGKINEQFLEDGIHVSKETHNRIAEIIYNSHIFS
jgi:lysophospholipase L1-like esterase